MSKLRPLYTLGLLGIALLLLYNAMIWAGLPAWLSWLPVAVGLVIAPLLIVIAVLVYVRVYRDPVHRDPVVVTASRDSRAIMHIPLADIPAVGKALQRAQILGSTLTMNIITPQQWQRAERAAQSPQGALEGFCEALGARLREPVRDTPATTPARDITLPALTLRFARESALCVITGQALQRGDAMSLATALHRDGKGPREVVALDVTLDQNARAVLQDAPHVSFVVLSSEQFRDLLLSNQPDREFEQVLVDQHAIADLSPYQTQGAVKQESFFFGRDRELRLMADRELRSFLLVGARQMGKSTLLQALARRLHGRTDVQAHYVELASGDIIAHLEHHARHTPALASHTPAPASQQTTEQAIRTAADRLSACAAGTVEMPRVWLLDETDQFVREDAAREYALTRAMRKLTSEKRAYFVLAGYWDLYAAKFLDPEHPLRNLGELIELGPLDQRAAEHLACKPMAALGITWRVDALQRVVHGTGRRANLIVLACKALIESLPADQREITLEHVEAMLRGDAVVRDRTQAYKALRDELAIPRRKPYTHLDRAIAYQAMLMPTPTARAVRQALSERGLAPSGTAYDDALARLELGYLLIDTGDDGLTCPVPLMRERLERRGLEYLLQDCLDDARSP